MKCYYGEPDVCSGEMWECETCGQTYCEMHNHATSKGINVECVVCERERLEEQIPSVPKDLEQSLTVMFASLVPGEGPAQTLEGELMRAVNRVLYRFYNDGDVWYGKYGIETVGPAVAFLEKCSPVDIKSDIRRSEYSPNKIYAEAWFDIARKLIEHIQSLKGKYSDNHYDMFDFKAKYHEYSVEEDDYY